MKPICVLFLAALALCACATTVPETRWAARTDASLAADLAACRTEAGRVDIQSAQGYSDGRYGAAAAMAGRLDEESLRGGGAAIAFSAVRDACMTKKGWTKAP